MLQEIETTTQEDTVTMSASARDAVRGILTERKLEGYSLRVYVAGGGCCGASFGMALDNNLRDNDFTFSSGDVQVVVDDQSLPYLRGAKIDYINDPVRGAGFTVDSPSNSSGSCSCGSEGHSHSHAESEGSTCACGGSCSCNN
ncbi:MAG TPA: iron-sulfur cluster assembly accessory protein [Anaerolineales bacterium]|jgi:iron-sulfur cluster assembly accessory protein